MQARVNFTINLLKPTGHGMHQRFNIQQLYVLPALYLCVLYLSENKQKASLMSIFIILKFNSENSLRW